MRYFWLIFLTLLVPYSTFAGQPGAGIAAAARHNPPRKLSREEFEKEMEARSRQEAQMLKPRAEAGDAAAQYQLGNMYFVGDGVEKDNAKAVKWYRKAADQGHANAQKKLGFMYFVGAGVTKDNAETAHWWEKAADRGLFEAQWNVGGMYEIGKGVKQDDVQAYKWYSLALKNKQGIRDSDPEMGRARQEQQLKELSHRMTKQEIARAERLIASWKPLPSPWPACPTDDRPNNVDTNWCEAVSLFFVKPPV